jgi:hypothetical protein
VCGRVVEEPVYEGVVEDDRLLALHVEIGEEDFDFARESILC